MLPYSAVIKVKDVGFKSFAGTINAIESLPSPLLFVIKKRFCFFLPTTNGFPKSKMKGRGII